MNEIEFYFRLGWDHIIDPEALDHILFIISLAAIYQLRDWRAVLILVTAFTIGHAITLLLGAKGWLTVSDRWVEFAIACTIFLTCISNLLIRNYTARNLRINYLLAFAFGLIHGLAFATALMGILAKDQQFAPAWISFSLGLEAGQMLIVLLTLVCCYLITQLARVPRKAWVWTVSIVIALFSVNMAIKRFPGRERYKSFVSINCPVIKIRRLRDIVHQVSFTSQLSTSSI